ncbi:MAG: signal peptide peptidase SppA [Halorientalis sp.]
MASDGRGRLRAAGRGIVGLVTALVLAAAAAFALVVYPRDLTDLLGVAALLAAVPLVARVAGSVAGSALPDYNVAEVAVEGPITRSVGGGIVSRPIGADADAIVEQIERADADRSAEALLLKLNTPGGEIVPSEDIRLAAERFEGPVVAHATDVCASGGYDVASGCDEVWARSGSIVGSIGVIGSRVNVSDLADDLGVSYEQFTAGEYKDAGLPLKELDEDERAYLQGIVDDYYDDFVATVAEGREMDPEALRETEARVYLGEKAQDLGLVDEIGTREDVTDRLAERLGRPVNVREFQPSLGLSERLRGGAARLAYAVGAGAARVVTDTDGFDFRL